MALTTLNLATLPLKFAIPVLAGLAAGTGGVAAYVTAPATAVAALPSPAPVATEQGQAAPARPNTKPSCERETWPYIDNRCITRRGNESERKVRFVMAPRVSDAAPSAASPDLVTSDTVLRGPVVAPEANEQPVKKPAKRSERRSERRQVQRGYSVYSVPSRGGEKPVIVVRPLRLNTFSSRF